MYSDRRRFGDERYSDAWNAQPYQREDARRSEHRRQYHRGRYEGYENYDADCRHEYSTQSGGTEYRGTQSRSSSYHGTNSDRRRPFDFQRDFEVVDRDDRYHSRDSPENSHDESHSRRSRNENVHLQGPSLFTPRRSPSASPPPPPIPTSPSPAYLEIASEPSKSVSSPPRKLIILDLNGTLLLRLRSIGAVYPRPFMPTFRDFLFCPATRKWLDVMIWSSAQPHNVERMVQRCFFDARLGPPPPELEAEESALLDGKKEKDRWDGKLAAIWGRDTLGLTSSDYHRKSQTTKDLEKPWAALPGHHGPCTTVLLDDSPRKARLQPFNHICINDYTAELREYNMSLKRRKREQEKIGKPIDADQGENVRESASREGDNQAEVEELRRVKQSVPTEERDGDATRKPESAKLAQESEYDSTLLATIGILDAIKSESNVASWIRSGGLWAGKTPPLPASAKEMESGERPSSPTDLEVNNEDDVARPVSPTQTKRQRSIGYEASVGASIGGDIKRTKFVGNEGAADADEPASAGNDVLTTVSVVNTDNISASHLGSNAKVDGDGSNRETSGAKLWFEDEETFQIWVNRGRAALRELGIEERDGVFVE